MNFVYNFMHNVAFVQSVSVNVYYPMCVHCALYIGVVNNYIVRSYRYVIVVSYIATRRTSKVNSIFMY